MRTFVCILKSGGDYKPKHVQVLQNQVIRAMPSTERFLCLTDHSSIRNVEILPLKFDLRGKYSMMEAFRIQGQVIVMGIDTVLVGDLNFMWSVVAEMESNDFYLMRSFNAKREYGNNPHAWNGDWSKLLYDFPVKDCYKYSLEQEYTIKKLKSVGANIKVLNDHATIRSFKHHYMKQKLKVTDAEVLVFHGHPRPHQVTIPWVKELYQ